MNRLKTKVFSRLLGTAFVSLIWIPQLTHANAFRCIDAHSAEAIFESNHRLALAATWERLIKTESFALMSHQGLPMSVEITPAVDPRLPYLLLMPGVRRPVFIGDPSYMDMVRRGYGVVSYSYSRQPFSLNKFKATEGHSNFRYIDFKFEDLIKENDLVIQNLKERGIHNVVPVSLSLSSATAPYLKGFPLIIDAAPMTSWAAALPKPELLENRKKLQAWQFWNPFFGPMIVRHQLDDAYRKDFDKEVDDQIQKLGLDPKKRSDYVEGWTQVTRTAEDSDWSHLQLSPETRHVFVVGLLRENMRLLLNQLQTYQRQVMDLRNDNLLVVVRNAGHFIPIQQPTVFAAIVDMILSNPDQVKGGVFLIGDTINDSRYISDRKDAAKLIQQLIDDTIRDIADNAEEAKKK